MSMFLFSNWKYCSSRDITREMNQSDVREMKFWYANIHDDYLLTHYNEMLLKLTPEEQRNVTKFVFEIDRYRALLSILMQRAVINNTFQFDRLSQYTIKRSSTVRVGFLLHEDNFQLIQLFPPNCRTSHICKRVMQKY